MPATVHPANFKLVEVLIRDIQTLMDRARALGMTRTANALSGARNTAEWEYGAQVVPP